MHNIAFDKQKCSNLLMDNYNGMNAGILPYCDGKASLRFIILHHNITYDMQMHKCEIGAAKLITIHCKYTVT